MGKIVVIEETEEPGIFLKTAVFKSALSEHFQCTYQLVSVNGVIKYFKYQKGTFAAAYLPKSSIENERTTIVIECNNSKTA